MVAIAASIVLVIRLGMVQGLQTLKAEILLAIKNLELWIHTASSTHSWWDLTAHGKSC